MIRGFRESAVLRLSLEFGPRQECVQIVSRLLSCTVLCWKYRGGGTILFCQGPQLVPLYITLSIGYGDNALILKPSS